MSKEAIEKKQGPLDSNQRWSARRKREVVLRLLRGEPLEAVSREVGVEVYLLEQWRAQALTGIDEALRTRAGDPLQTELDKAMRRIGELSMECEVLGREHDLRRPLARKRRSK